MGRPAFIGFALALLGVATPSTPAAAHPVPFSYVDVRIGPAALDVTIVAHVYDVAHDLGVEPVERLLEPSVLASRADAITTLLRSRFELLGDGQPLRAGVWSAPEALPERQSIQVRARFDAGRPFGMVKVNATLFPYDPQHQTFLNVYEKGVIASQAILSLGRGQFEYFGGTRQGVVAVLRKFLPAGFQHILIGPEHLLFLVGLLLLGGSPRRLLLVVAAYTVAHSIALSLAALNIVAPPAGVVEPAIALSIVYVGADNLMVRGGRDVRGWIALAFGFIHGFGFANVLRQMDLPARALGWSLFSFNVGVEIGQLFVVVAVASGLALLRRRSEAAGQRLVFAGSMVVIAAGTFWFIQRVFFSGGIA
jgi:hydrogenase/urease accessory protein HupE